VKLYQSSNGSWKEVCTGCAVSVTEKTSHYIKIVGMAMTSVLFTQELYHNFGYEKPKSFFHTFEMDEAVAGLSFASDSEAQTFFSEVSKMKIEMTPRPPSSPALRIPL
jgi:hypothetical protein